MATNRWVGSASAIAQLNTVVVGGTPAAGQTYTLTIAAAAGNKTVTYTALVTDTNTLIATALQAALAASTIPEFREITYANPTAATLTAKATTAGKPFVMTSGASGTGTLVTTLTVVNSGPNDVSCALNWSTGAIPGADDVFLQNSNVGLLYNLQALAAVTLNSLTVDASFTGAIGLPYNNGSGYVEYRQRYLQFAGATNGVTIAKAGGSGGGSGSGKIQLDTGTTVTTVNLWKTGSSTEQGIPSFLWKGNAANTLNVNRGVYGLALFAGEVWGGAGGTINQGYQTSVQGDVTGTCGPGCTLGTVTKTGGTLTMNSAPTVLVNYAGTAKIQAGNPTTIDVWGGTVFYWPSLAGTIANNFIRKGGTLDTVGTQAVVTLTNSTWYTGAKINAPGGNVTMTNFASTPDGQASDVTLAMGTGRTVKVV